MIEHVIRSINNAENHQSKLDQNVLNIDGMSSPKIRHFLNNIVDMPNAKYLEVGTWKGSTLCSALYNNSPNFAVAIDNFSEFSGPRAELRNNVSNYVRCNLTFYDQDCFKFDKSLLSDKVNIYLYDGNHSRESHERALTYFIDVLDDTFIYICDDWNFPEVPLGTQDAFDKLNLTIEKAWVLPANHNGDTKNWWNGFYVAVIRKNG
jgi:hypothetical protein